MKSTITIAILLLFSFILSAQQKLSIGNFRCHSTLGPLMYYWNNPQISSQFQKDLDSILQNRWQLSLNHNEQFLFQQTPNAGFTNNSPGKNLISSISMDIVEYGPAALYKIMEPKNSTDSAFFIDLLSGLRFIVQITDNKGTTIFSKELEVYLKRGPGNGIGLPIANMSLTGKAFTDVLKYSMNFLLNKNDSMQVIDMKSSGAFAGDNFLLPIISGKPRIPVVSKNSISRFAIQTKQQIVRWDKQLYREIILSGTKKTSITDSLQVAIKKQRKNGSSVFLYLVQDLRDVISNKTYRMEMPAQMSTSEFTGFNEAPLVELIKGDHHYLLDGSDTIAKFSIQTGIIDSTKQFQLNTITNGVDAKSAVILVTGQTNIPMTYEYVIVGKHKQNSFSIKSGANRFIKELWLDNTLVAIVYGAVAPDKIVLLEESIDTSLLNMLILIGYNSFFQ